MDPTPPLDSVYQLGLGLVTPISESTTESDGTNHISQTPTKQVANPVRNTIEIIVGTHGKHSYQKTYHLHRALLAQHSTLFNAISFFQSSIYITTTPPHMFQNFLDYAHSNIYSLNRNIPDYSPVHQHTLAHLLGAELGAPEFQAAALRKLHALFEPWSRSGDCTAARSPIRARDVAFVCENSAPNSSIRRLFLDAVASHWTGFDAANIGILDHGAEDPDNGHDDDTNRGEPMVKWSEVYDKHNDFRDIVRAILMFGDEPRDTLLGGIQEYIAGDKRKVGVEIEVEEKRGRKRKLPSRSTANGRGAGLHNGVKMRRSASRDSEMEENQGSAVPERE